MLVCLFACLLACCCCESCNKKPNRPCHHHRNDASVTKTLGNQVIYIYIYIRQIERIPEPERIRIFHGSCHVTASCFRCSVGCHGKNSDIIYFQLTYWLFNRDPYNVLTYNGLRKSSPPNCLGFRPQKIT